MKRTPTAGFTFIELMVVLIVIGILAAIAIPKYMEFDNRAKVSTCKGILVHVRAALVLRFYEAKMRGIQEWPGVEDVLNNDNHAGCKIMQFGKLPDNPFSTGVRRDAVVVVRGKPNPTGTGGAWAYDPDTGGFWANTDSGNKEIDY